MLAPTAARCDSHEENPVDTSSAVIAALGCGLALSGPVVAGTSEVNVQQIETTRAPADHEVIAKAYGDEAARLDARVKVHADMVRLHMLGESEDTPSAVSMREHCDGLAKSYRDAAAAARQMAAGHRAMAHAH
jgi:hypothetical protein